MSRLLVTNKSFELLEPYEGKLSRTVLRGESSRKGADLLDIIMSTYRYSNHIMKMELFVFTIRLYPEKKRMEVLNGRRTVS